MNSFSQFMLDCLDPRTEYGQGFLAASVIGFIVNVIFGMRR